MSIINTKTSQSTPKEEQLQKLIFGIKNMSTITYNQLLTIQKRGVDMVWNNPNFTPQEIVDAIGPEAIKIFQFHGGLTNLLVGISQLDGIDYTPALPTNAFTVNLSTGAITVEEGPYIP